MDRDRHLSPAQGDISDALLRLQGGFGWETRADRYDLIDHWERPRSGSSFYRMAGSDGPDLVAKSVAEWAPGAAQSVFDAMVELDDMIASAGIDGAHGIRPLAWSDDPPLLVMPYVESLDVVSILRQPEHQAWQSGDLERWIEQAGAVLAVYHQSPPPGWQPDIGQAEVEVRELAGKLRVDTTTIDRVLSRADWRIRSRRRYGDYGPGNLQGATDGSLYLLDPPEESHTSVIHRDISNFLFEMRRQLAGRGFTPSPPVRGWFPDYRERFLFGYLRRWPELSFGSADDALIALFEVKRAAAMSRKRLPTRLGDALWFARLASRRRFDLRQATKQLASEG